MEKLDTHHYKFTIDVYDAKEMIPWIRTFIGRIVHLECSNKEVVDKFYKDFQMVYDAYMGGDEDVVQ